MKYNVFLMLFPWSFLLLELGMGGLLACVSLWIGYGLLLWALHRRAQIDQRRFLNELASQRSASKTRRG